jgi:hypothetical protein
MAECREQSDLAEVSRRVKGEPRADQRPGAPPPEEGLPAQQEAGEAALSGLQALQRSAGCGGKKKEQLARQAQPLESASSLAELTSNSSPEFHARCGRLTTRLAEAALRALRLHQSALSSSHSSPGGPLSSSTHRPNPASLPSQPACPFATFCPSPRLCCARSARSALRHGKACARLQLLSLCLYRSLRPITFASARGSTPSGNACA